MGRGGTFSARGGASTPAPGLESLGPDEPGAPLAVFFPPQVGSWERLHRARQSGPQFDPKKAVRTAANRKRILKALHDGGAPVIFGTDAPQQFSVPGFSVHREMASMLEAGLTPYEIIRTATRNAGEYYKNKARFGTVATGQRGPPLLRTCIDHRRRDIGMS